MQVGNKLYWTNMTAGASTAIAASLSSMQEASKKVTVISGNIANIDTRGYKVFELSHHNVINSGGQVSSGVSSIIRRNIEQEGQIIRTDVDTDIMITGKGMIPVAQLDSDGNRIGTYFTRDGVFRKDQKDQLVTPYGYTLLAWPLDANGGLPQTKSLSSSMQPVNVKALISEASATTTVEIGVSLSSEQAAVGGGVKTLNIISTDSVSSYYNESIGPEELLFANPNNSLTQGEGIEVRIYDESKQAFVTKQILFDGFAVSSSLTNAETDLTGSSATQLTITAGSTTHTFTRGSGTTNLEVLTNLADQINETEGDQRIRARVVNLGSTSKLMVAPADIDLAMTFGGDSSFRNAIGLTDGQKTSTFTTSDSSRIAGRFASMSDLATVLSSIGIVSTTQDSDSTGGTITIKATKSVYFNNARPLNRGSDFLREFGLTSGYLQSSYDPYDQQNNMAGGIFKAHHTQDFSVYDSKGIGHNMIIAFLKTDANTWAVEIYGVKKEELDIPGRSDGLIVAGTVVFDGSGRLAEINGTTQTAKSIDIDVPEAALGATEGQTFTVEVNNTIHTFYYGDNINSSATYEPLGTELVGAPGDVLRIQVDTVTHTVVRGDGANNLDVLRNIVRQINKTSGTEAVKAELHYNKVNDLYHLTVKAADPTKTVSYTQANGNSLASAAFTPDGDTLDGITGTLTLTVGSTTFNGVGETLNLATVRGVLTEDEDIIDAIIAAIEGNSSFDDNIVATKVTNSETGEVSLLLEPASGNEDETISLAFSDTDSQTALGLANAGNFGSALEMLTFKSASFDPSATTLVGTSTDDLVFKVGSTDYTITRGTGTTNLEVLESMVTAIEALGGTPLQAEIKTDGATGNIYLSISATNPTNRIILTSDSTGTLVTAMSINSEKTVTGNSFKSLLDLAEQINRTTGTDAITADILPGTESNTYSIKIKPVSDGNFMSFGGSVSEISPPLGISADDSIYNALGLTTTSEANQLAALDEDFSIRWAATIGADNNTISLNIGTIGDKDGLSEASGSFSTKKNEQNGVSSGNLSKIVIDPDGFITASFSNGQTRKIYKIPVADFANIDGLLPYFGNVFTVSKDSGPMNLKEAKSQGAGSFTSGSLEGSNVDMAGQLADMIVAQQRYQASTKTLNTVNEMTKSLLQAV